MNSQELKRYLGVTQTLLLIHEKARSWRGARECNQEVVRPKVGIENRGSARYSTDPAKFVLDSNGTYFVSFPTVPETKTFVEDKSTANPVAALSFYVEASKRSPVPSAIERGQISVYLSASTVAKLALYQTMREQAISSPN